MLKMMMMIARIMVLVATRCGDNAAADAADDDDDTYHYRHPMGTPNHGGGGKCFNLQPNPVEHSLISIMKCIHYLRKLTYCR